MTEVGPTLCSRTRGLPRGTHTQSTMRCQDRDWNDKDESQGEWRTDGHQTQKKRNNRSCDHPRTGGPPNCSFENTGQCLPVAWETLIKQSSQQRQYLLPYSPHQRELWGTADKGSSGYLPREHGEPLLCVPALSYCYLQTQGSSTL